MISKSWLKLVKSLQIKKFRVKEGLFLVEGTKSVLELINSSFSLKAIFCTQKFYEDYTTQLIKTKALIEVTTEQDLEAGGTFSTNNSVIAVAYIKPQKKINLEKGEIGLMLDSVKDPGNLGTIIRIADWYGINKIVMSPDCVDFYNPKVITSSMGSFTRIEFFYTDLVNYIQQIDTNTKLIGAFMNGENVHRFPFPEGGFLIMGNESLGINPTLETKVNYKINIPSYGNAESLNVAVATAIICDNWKKSLTTNF